jgi:hypothetical protein
MAKGEASARQKKAATAKAHAFAVHGYYAVGHVILHGKGAFAVRKIPFSFFHFYFVFLILMFISQLVLYFVDYLLVLLKTMCIYPLTRV